MGTYRKAKSALEAAKQIQQEVLNRTPSLPAEVSPPPDQPVLPHSLVSGTRGYIEKVVYQINRSYSGTCYDACAVMIRRLVEILIIEAFEHYGIASRICGPDDNYLHLEELVRLVLAEQSWRLGRNTKTALRKMKRIGDHSAHSRRYNARRQYVDDIVIDLRVATEELLYVAGLRR